MKIEYLESKELFKGLRFSVERRKYRFNKRVVERDIVVFPDTVVILPELDEKTILLIKQYRPALNQYIYEAPAGVVEPDEPVRKAAERELMEELGYVPNELIELGVFYPTPGYSTEKMHFFLARKLEYVGAKPEPYEVIKPVSISIDKAVEMIRDNLINDLKTIAIILYYLRFISSS